jgi:RHS repeat-associated protein
LMSCQRIDGGKKEPIARYQYNALGEVVSKVQGCNQQTLTYQTDLRGRLLRMNSTDPTALRTQKQFFGFGLTYTLDDNIQRQDWASQPGLKASDALGTSHHYAYAYDGLQRLQTAHYNGQANHAYSVTGMAYDGNGNIKALTRPGVDNLSYRYKAGSNTLLEVSDGSDATRGFKDAHTGTDYEYDLAGNLTVDRNRGITNISYNALGLAEAITFGGDKPGTIRYVYSGGGSKLRKEGAFVPVNNVPSQTPTVGQQTLDYIAGLLYTDNTLSHVPTGEGRALPPVAQLGSEWRYEYQQSDHLGNLRSACRCGEQVNASTGAVEPLVSAEPRVLVQSGHYDPWGLNLSDLEAKSGKGVDLWQFNSSSEKSYNPDGTYTYDTDNRGYDPAIGRFGGVDALADKYPTWSPYAFGKNNPILYADPQGLEALDWVQLGKGKPFWDAAITSQAGAVAKYGANATWLGQSFLGSVNGGLLQHFASDGKIYDAVQLASNVTIYKEPFYKDFLNATAGSTDNVNKAAAYLMASGFFDKTPIGKGAAIQNEGNWSIGYLEASHFKSWTGLFAEAKASAVEVNLLGKIGWEQLNAYYDTKGTLFAAKGEVNTGLLLGENKKYGFSLGGGAEASLVSAEYGGGVSIFGTRIGGGVKRIAGGLSANRTFSAVYDAKKGVFKTTYKVGLAIGVGAEFKVSADFPVDISTVKKNFRDFANAFK